MPNDSHAGFKFQLKDTSSVTRSLHDRLVDSLTTNFANFVVGPNGPDTGADILLRMGNKVVLVEVKAGDPGLPLPSSTLSQMKLLAQQTRNILGHQDLDSVVVTNHRVFPEQQAELAASGVKVMSVPSSFDPATLASGIRDIVNL